MIHLCRDLNSSSSSTPIPQPTGTKSDLPTSPKRFSTNPTTIMQLHFRGCWEIGEITCDQSITVGIKMPSPVDCDFYQSPVTSSAQCEAFLCTFYLIVCGASKTHPTQLQAAMPVCLFTYVPLSSGTPVQWVVPVQLVSRLVWVYKIMGANIQVNCD